MGKYKDFYSFCINQQHLNLAECLQNHKRQVLIIRGENSIQTYNKEALIKTVNRFVKDTSGTPLILSRHARCVTIICTIKEKHFISLLDH